MRRGLRHKLVLQDDRYGSRMGSAFDRTPYRYHHLYHGKRFASTKLAVADSRRVNR
jgi:hypothetical protein